jgi:hypothetical protein
MFANKFVAILTLFQMAILGCGNSEISSKTVQTNARPGLNGGMVFPIDEDKGYVELVIEVTKPGQPVTIAAYFLNENMDGPITSPPTSVISELNLPTEESPKEVTLTPVAAKSGKKSVGTRFATAPGSYDFDQLYGDLRMTLDGKNFVVPFAL